MPYLRFIAEKIDLFSELLGSALAWLTLGMVVVGFSVVVLRYGFDLGWIAMQESVTYLHAIAFMLAAGYTLKYDGHVRVDIFYRKLSAKQQAWVDLLGGVLLLLPLCGFVLWISLDYVETAWRLKEGSRDAGGLPYLYLLKTCSPLLAITLALQGISTICRSLISILESRQAPA